MINPSKTNFPDFGGESEPGLAHILEQQWFHVFKNIVYLTGVHTPRGSVTIFLRSIYRMTEDWKYKEEIFSGYHRYILEKSSLKLVIV